MKILKKILCTLLIVVMCLTAAPLEGFVGIEMPDFSEWFAGKASATDEYPTSGKCGDNAYWSFDENTGTLTISGEGSAWTGSEVEGNSIVHYVDDITKLVVEEGIVEFGRNQYVYPNLREISFPDSLEIFYPGTFDDSAYYNDESNWENGGLYVGDCFIQSRVDAEGTLVVRDGTTRMSIYAISNSNYTDVILPESLKTISTGAFAFQTQLRSVQFGGNVEKIGDAAFTACSSLEIITGLGSVKEIGIDAFGLCYKLKSIDLSAAEKIGDMAFGLCLSLDELDLSSAKEIGEQAFMFCASLDDITLPSSLNSIGKEAFSSCLFLDEAYIYNPNMSFSENSLCVSNMIRTDDLSKEELVALFVNYYDTIFALAGSADKSEAEAIYAEIEKHVVEYETPQPCGTIVCYKGSTAETYAIENGINYRYFPEEEPNRTVVDTGQCGDYVFYTLYSDGELVISGEGDMWNYTAEGLSFSDIDIKTVTVENGVTTIGEEIFDACYSLESIFISESVKTIEKEAFYNCIELKNVDLGDNLETIGDRAFYNCWNLKEITIPESAINIGNDVFTTCNQLEFIYVKNNNSNYSNDEAGVLFNKDKTVLIKYPIGNQRNEYKLPETVKIIGDSAFEGSTKLEVIEMCEGVEVIERNAFSDITSLVKVSVPDSVAEIKSLAFAGCENLNAVTIGKGVKTIDDGVFAFCINLTDIYFNGTESEWNSIIIDEDNEEIFSATIHFLDECEHNPIEQTVPSSCTVAGMKFYVCSECGEPIGESEIIPAAHTPGEWETAIEPTYEVEGKKIKKCIVCGITIQEETIPKLEKLFVEDKKTGVGIEYPSDKYDGKVEISVEESFDGTAFNILDTKTGAVDSKIYDIKLLVNGGETQPNGKVTVKIPLPAGYNPKFSFVYYVNSETGALEKMNAVYVDGYMVFETDHFSYYAVIVEPDVDNCSCKCHSTSFLTRIIWRITIFFNKLLRKNKVCSCGIYHY